MKVEVDWLERAKRSFASLENPWVVTMTLGAREGRKGPYEICVAWVRAWPWRSESPTPEVLLSLDELPANETAVLEISPLQLGWGRLRFRARKVTFLVRDRSEKDAQRVQIVSEVLVIPPLQKSVAQTLLLLLFPACLLFSYLQARKAIPDVLGTVQAALALVPGIFAAILGSLVNRHGLPWFGVAHRFRRIAPIFLLALIAAFAPTCMLARVHNRTEGAIVLPAKLLRSMRLPPGRWTTQWTSDLPSEDTFREWQEANAEDGKAYCYSGARESDPPCADRMAPWDEALLELLMRTRVVIGCAGEVTIPGDKLVHSCGQPNCPFRARDDRCEARGGDVVAVKLDAYAPTEEARPHACGEAANAAGALEVRVPVPVSTDFAAVCLDPIANAEVAWSRDAGESPGWIGARARAPAKAPRGLAWIPRVLLRETARVRRDDHDVAAFDCPRTGRDDTLTIRDALTGAIRDLHLVERVEIGGGTARWDPSDSDTVLGETGTITSCEVGTTTEGPARARIVLTAGLPTWLSFVVPGRASGIDLDIETRDAEAGTLVCTGTGDRFDLWRLPLSNSASGPATQSLWSAQRVVLARGDAWTSTWSAGAPADHAWACIPAAPPSAAHVDGAAAVYRRSGDRPFLLPRPPAPCCAEAEGRCLPACPAGMRLDETGSDSRCAGGVTYRCLPRQ